MRSARRIGFGLVLLAVVMDMGVAMGKADAPREVEHDRKVYSPNRRSYVVSLLKERRTAVFRVGSPKKPEWEIPGYASVLFLSDDGRHLVEGYSGGNILSPEVKGTDVFLVFFAGPQRVATLTVGEVFPHWETLPQTTDGKVWGNFWGFEGPVRFSLLLNDGHKIAFDANTGKKIDGN